MMVNSFCGEFLLQSHAALHGEFLLVLHDLCWFMQGAPLGCPHAGLYGEFLLHAQCWFTCGVSYTPHAGFFLLGVSLIRSMLASLCSEFLLYKTKNVKVNKNVHN